MVRESSWCWASWPCCFPNSCFASPPPPAYYASRRSRWDVSERSKTVNERRIWLTDDVIDFSGQNNNYLLPSKQSSYWEGGGGVLTTELVFILHDKYMRTEFSLLVRGLCDDYTGGRILHLLRLMKVHSAPCSLPSPDSPWVCQKCYYHSTIYWKPMMGKRWRIQNSMIFISKLNFDDEAVEHTGGRDL